MNVAPAVISTFIFGGIALIIGSFLTMLIYRLPQMIKGLAISPLTPKRSTCPHCNNTIKLLHLIPILGYILQKGQCTYCNNVISVMYPIVEFITVIFTIILYIVIGWDVALIFWLLFGYGCIILFFTDWFTRIVPNIITVSLIWIGLIFHMLYGDIKNAIIGGIIGYISYWVYKSLTHKRGIKPEDCKVLALIGIWLGWYALHYIILITCLGVITYVFIIKGHTRAVTSFMILSIPIYKLLDI